MTLPAFFFYIFSAIIVASAVMVISSRNPVHSVLFLILAFVNAAGVFVAGAEFLAMILIIVYVGAVAVLFLFVVMMLDVDFGEMKKGYLQYMPIGVLVGTVLLVELLLVAGSAFVGPQLAAGSVLPMDTTISNTRALGEVLYTRYVFLFQGAGLILLVAMIGAIVLTLHHKPKVKRQDINKQNARTPETAVKVVKVKSGQGL